MKLAKKQITDLIATYGFEYKIIIKNIDYKATIGKLKNGLFIIRDVFSKSGMWQHIPQREVQQLLEDAIYVESEIFVTTMYHTEFYLNDTNIGGFEL